MDSNLVPDILYELRQFVKDSVITPYLTQAGDVLRKYVVVNTTKVKPEVQTYLIFSEILSLFIFFNCETRALIFCTYSLFSCSNANATG